MEKLKTLLIANRGEIAVRGPGGPREREGRGIVPLSTKLTSPFVGPHLQNRKEAEHQDHRRIFGS